MASIPDVVPESQQGGAPDGVEDVFQDENDDNVKPITIADDSDDELARCTPSGGGGAASSGTLQYSPRFSTLNLDAMRQQGVVGVPVGFGARDTQDTGRLVEFKVDQQFQDKEEVVLSVKTYSI
ncbi:hypothetical protein Ahy_B07g086338 [Arachis hypogaea]|uniref:Uncharacterized protein n=1 Tax=Arachis hypogaea TaxID=3818 RepID=A0A444Y9J6_ARAHY|nr:hypothetical protein Ahy_B07g086338 [Arachis hypogaea]